MWWWESVLVLSVIYIGSSCECLPQESPLCYVQRGGGSGKISRQDGAWVVQVVMVGVVLVVLMVVEVELVGMMVLVVQVVMVVVVLLVLLVLLVIVTVLVMLVGMIVLVVHMVLVGMTVTMVAMVLAMMKMIKKTPLLQREANTPAFRCEAGGPGLLPPQDGWKYSTKLHKKAYREEALFPLLHCYITTLFQRGQPAHSHTGTSG